MKFVKKKNDSIKSTSNAAGNGNMPEFKDNEVTFANIKRILSDSDDINYQIHYINNRPDLSVTLIYVDGMVDTKIVNEDILKPLTQEKAFMEAKNAKDIIEFIENGAIYHSSRKKRLTLKETLEDILKGSAALVFDSEKTAVTFEVIGYEKRAVTEPVAENAVKGSKDSFIEVLRVNTSLVRRKITSPYLRIKEVFAGKHTRTAIAVIYIENITNKKIVNEVFKRLNSTNVDGVISAGYIEEYIKDRKRTIFPLMLNTERTDKFCQYLLEGRIGLIIDGLPNAYILPATFNIFFQAPEDYSQHFVISSFLRCLRYICAVISLTLPGFYIALTTFHQEMIPTLLAYTIVKSKQNVPFPTSTSVLFMQVAFEILLEAGLRLPKYIGQAISIIGALVVGQAAVQANLISPLVVIIIALTGMTGFTIPNQDFSNSMRIVRFVLILFSTIAGLYGLSIGLVLIIYHLNTLDTFGVPYLSPFVASEGKGIAKDTIIRMPLFLMKKRPVNLKVTDKKSKG